MERHPFPYTQEDLAQSGRIFYYESSRGCPHGCSYCLSSAQRGVRFKPLAQVFSDLRKFSDAGVRLVKFVDRTFNADLKRSKELLRFLPTLSPQFHIEVAADTLDREFLELLSAFPSGQLRIEAGLQSTNPQTLEAIGRRCDLKRLAENIHYIPFSYTHLLSLRRCCHTQSRCAR